MATRSAGVNPGWSPARPTAARSSSVTPSSMARGVRHARHTVHWLICATRMRTSSCSRHPRELRPTAFSRAATAGANCGRSVNALVISGPSPSGRGMRAMDERYFDLRRHGQECPLNRCPIRVEVMGMTAGWEEPPTRPLRVVLVDDSRVMRAVLRVRLQLDGFAVVGEADDGDEGIRLVTRLQPDIAVLDLEMRHLSGMVALPAIRRVSPHTAVVVFSWFPDPFTLGNLLELGADAYVDKAGGPAKLVAHLRALASSPTTVTAELDD